VTFITRLRLGMLRSMSRPRHDAPIREGGLASRGSACPTFLRWLKIQKDPNTVWKLTTIANWYGNGERMVEITSETAVWYSTGLFAVPLRWVLVRDPQKEFKTQALLCVPTLELIRRRSSPGS
jgi:hypothetical protein